MLLLVGVLTKIREPCVREERFRIMSSRASPSCCIQIEENPGLHYRSYDDGFSGEIGSGYVALVNLLPCEYL